MSQIVSERNVKTDLHIKEEPNDRKDFKTDTQKQHLNDTCSNTVEIIDNSSNLEGCVGECSLQVKSEEVDFENNHRGCNLKQEGGTHFVHYSESNVDVNETQDKNNEIDSQFKKLIDEKGKKWFQCNICEYKYKSEYHIKLHINGKHSGKVRCYQCNLCDLKTKCKRVLMRHFSTRHDANLEMYDCLFCGSEFKRKDALKKHIALKHSENTQLHHCKFCTFQTKHKHSLKQHFKRKHDENPEMYHCQLCERKFKLKYDLQQHNSRHIGKDNLMNE